MRELAHRLTGAGVLVLACAAPALATPQVLEKLTYGPGRFVMFQRPMTGLWHYGDGEPPAAKVMPPKLEVTSSNNWGGYTAAWRIAGGKLLLDTISGRLDGEAVRDEALLPGKKFPVVATWFTGKLHLPIGDYNEQTQEYEFVIVFDIEKGIVQSKAMSMSARISRTWNGR